MPKRVLTAADATALNSALTALTEPTIPVADAVVQEHWVDYYTNLDPTTASVVANLNYVNSSKIAMLNGTTRVLADGELPADGEVVIEGDISSTTSTPPAAPSVGGGSGIGGSSTTIIPVTLTAHTHDFNPAGLASGVCLRFDQATNYDLTGIVAQSDGDRILIMNVGSGDLKLRNERTDSAAANRFLLAADLTLRGPTDSIWVIYDGTSSRWRAILIA